MIGLEIRNMYWKHARKQKKHKVLDKGIAKRSMIKPTDLCTAYK